MKYILSAAAILIIALGVYMISQEVSSYQQNSDSNASGASVNNAVIGNAVPDNTLASVNIDTNVTNTLTTKNILVLGDSLTAGYGIVLEKSWLYLLEKDIRNNFDDAYRVINAGISGDTSSGGFARLKQALEQYNPEIVIIELGGNDGLRGYPVKNISENLLNIIHSVKAAGAKAVLAGIQIPPNYGERYASSFASIYTQLSSQENVPLIPFILEGVALKEQWMQADGIHPNEDGQNRIKDNVMLVLTGVLNN